MASIKKMPKEWPFDLLNLPHPHSYATDDKNNNKTLFPRRKVLIVFIYHHRPLPPEF